MTIQEKLTIYLSKINSTFGLREQGDELVRLAAEVTSSNHVGLFFLDNEGSRFRLLSSNPNGASSAFSELRLGNQSAILKHLRQEGKTLAVQDITQSPALIRSLERAGKRNAISEIGFLSPLISRNRLVGILVIGKRKSGKHLPAIRDFMKEAASLSAVILEKEFLRERLSRQNSKLSRLYAKAEEEARVDGLTGLFNRRSFDEVIASEISRYSRYGGIFSLIMIDIDAFKRVNDEYGHLAGDEGLQKVGGVIRHGIRNSDQAFRYGGEEFVIILPSTPLDAANNVAERIRKQIASIVIVGRTSVTASIGVASWPAHGQALDEIIAAADAALYEAKRRGGNQCFSAPHHH